MTGERGNEFGELAGVERVTIHGLPAVRVDTESASGLVFLQGAHVAAFQPVGCEPVIWMSERAVYAPGKALRGGIPICFPWFGTNAEHPEYPAHGFARTREFAYGGARRGADGNTELDFEFASDERTEALFPHAFRARLRAAFGASLRLEFAVTNTGAHAFDFEAALHSYFRVSDVRQVVVRGLQGAGFADKVRGMARFTENASELKLVSETDRVYDSPSACTIRDAASKRAIRIEKSHSGATVVWNPWSEKAAQMADFATDSWPRMLCVESANVGPSRVTLGSGETHTLGVLVSIEAT